MTSAALLSSHPEASAWKHQETEQKGDECTCFSVDVSLILEHSNFPQAKPSFFALFKKFVADPTEWGFD